MGNTHYYAQKEEEMLTTLLSIQYRPEDFGFAINSLNAYFFVPVWLIVFATAPLVYRIAKRMVGDFVE